MTGGAQSDLFTSDSGPGESVDPLAARGVAFDLLKQILIRRTPMDQALDQSASFAALPPRDRAFARMMLATVLRRLGQVDDVILRAFDRPTAPDPPALLNLLRLGTVQIAFMNVPDHAAVNSTVDLAASIGFARQKNLVNAILRRVAREYEGWLAQQDESRLNVPDWLLRTWINHYGLRPAAEIALSNLREAALDITLKDPSHAAHWASVLEAEILPTGSLRRTAGGNVADLPGFADGTWWVQDAAAAIPARLFGDIAGLRVADLCAAPGGKTAQLAAMGAHVHALDRAATRLKRLNENLDRLGLSAHVSSEAADATNWHTRDPFDAILLDAPCSATGTIRRHPDVPHLKTPDDIDRLCATQSAMLDNAATLLKPGGVMVYCTCSLQKAEGEAQIDAFLTRHPAFARKPIQPGEIPGLEHALTPDGDMRILPQYWPEIGGIDGFFAARVVVQAV